MAYARVMALSGDYLSLYTVELENDRYYEYNATNEFKTLGLSLTGEDFFGKALEVGEKIVFEDDLPLYRSHFTKDTILQDIKEKGFFQLHYRLIIQGVRKSVVVKIVPVVENGNEKLIVGVRLWKTRQ